MSIVDRSALLGGAPAWIEFLEEIEVYATGGVPMVITGEPGDGKTQAAYHAHRVSARAKQVFDHINCAALDPLLLNSTLFGHERGAFTGAHKKRIGRLEAIGHGSAYFDELGELSLSDQAKLLMAVEDGFITPIGSNHTVELKCGWIFATWRDIEKDSVLRPDLRRRIPVHLRVPPLRERREDIGLLATHFAGIEISKACITQLENMPWEEGCGGVGALRNLMFRAKMWTSKREGSTVSEDDIQRALGRRKHCGRHQIDTETRRALLGLGDQAWTVKQFASSRSVALAQAYNIVNEMLEHGIVRKQAHGRYVLVSSSGIPVEHAGTSPQAAS